MTRFEAIWSGLAASPLARMAGVLLVAFVLGTAIGLERQWRQRTAGLRTNVLVALGAAAFTELGGRLLGPTARRASLPTSCPASAFSVPESSSRTAPTSAA